MYDDRELTAEEAALLRRAGERFGRDRLLGEPTLIGRLLGDLLPEERRARHLCDGLMQRPDGSALLSRLMDGEDVPLPLGTPEEATMLRRIMAAFFPREEAQPGISREISRNGTVPETSGEISRSGIVPERPREISRSGTASERPREISRNGTAPERPREISRSGALPDAARGPVQTLAQLPSAVMSEITGTNHREIRGRILVTTEGVMLYKLSTAGQVGAFMAGMVTMGLGMRAVLRNTSAAEQPSIRLPAEDIHAVVRQYMPAIHDLMIHMRNGRRFRVSCSSMESSRAEVEAVAAAIEGLCTR